MKFKPYPSYKDSGIEWLGEVPEYWELSKIAWDIKFTVGWTPSTDDASYYDGEYPWVTIDDMKNRYVFDTKKTISKKAI